MQPKNIYNIKNEVEKINSSQKHLQKPEEERWLTLLKEFGSNSNYLKSVNALEEQQSYKLLEEIASYQNFIAEYNTQLRRNELKQELLKLKEEILQAANEFSFLFYGQTPFS